MSQKDKSESLPAIGPRFSLTVENSIDAQSLLSSRSDISHRLFSGIDISGATAIQSLFPGAVFRNCILRECDFSRSDFEGARFEKCSLERVKFDNADIRSTQFIDCKIFDASLSNSYISDCNFRRCFIVGASFDGASIQRASFEDTRLEKISNRVATILHCEFIRTDVDGLKLGDCTALYTIFDQCTLRNFSINGDALGMTFGLTKRDLDSIGFVFLGEYQEVPEGIQPSLALIESFRARRWMMHSAIATLCFSDIPTVDGWRMVAEALASQIEGGRAPNIDEAQFVIRIMSNAESRDLLPFAAAIYAFDRVCQIIIDDPDAIAERKAAIFLRGELTLLIGKMQKRIINLYNFSDRLDEASKITCNFYFVSKPLVSPEVFLINSAVVSNSDILLLEGRAGSWIQPLETTVKGLLSILISLYLFEGCIIQLTHIRARTDVLLSPEVPKSFLDEAQDPKQEIPQAIQNVLRLLYKGYLSGAVKSPARAAGLNVAELKEVNILYSDEANPDSRSKK